MCNVKSTQLKYLRHSAFDGHIWLCGRVRRDRGGLRNPLVDGWTLAICAGKQHGPMAWLRIAYPTSRAILVVQCARVAEVVARPFLRDAAGVCIQAASTTYPVCAVSIYDGAACSGRANSFRDLGGACRRAERACLD